MGWGGLTHQAEEMSQKNALSRVGQEFGPHSGAPCPLHPRGWLCHLRWEHRHGLGVLSAEHASESPGGLIKPTWSDSTPRASDSAGLG